MAITSDRIAVSIRGVYLAQRVEVVQWYRPGGAAFVTATAAGVAEAYWNDIKTLWRAAHAVSALDKTFSVFVQEPGSSGAYGEYAVPSGEQEGTRSNTGLTDLLPATNSVGVRLTVATRTTRPGQKRFWGVWIADNNTGVLGAALAGLVDALAVKFDSIITLGAPVATGVLQPIVVRIDRDTGLPTADQDVIGHVVNPYITTQNSRKVGHGS